MEKLEENLDDISSVALLSPACFSRVFSVDIIKSNLRFKVTNMLLKVIGWMVKARNTSGQGL